MKEGKEGKVYPERKVYGKPAEHSRGVGLRVNAHLHITIQCRVKVASESVHHPVLFHLKLNSLESGVVDLPSCVPRKQQEKEKGEQGQGMTGEQAQAKNSQPSVSKFG